MEQPTAKANLISNIFFCWSLPFFYKRYRTKKITHGGYLPLKEHKSESIGKKLEAAWNLECSKSKPLLMKALWTVFRKQFVILGVFFFIIEFLLKMTQPWLIAKLMESYTNQSDEKDQNLKYLYGGLFLIANVLGVVTLHYYLIQVQHLGMQIRVACCSLIYRAALKIRIEAIHEIGTGQLINLMSNDVNRFDLTPMCIHQLMVVPIETAIVVYFLYQACGFDTVSGIGFLVLFVPAQMYLGKLAGKFRRKTATKTDVRIRRINEIISGIEVIKLFTLEKLYTNLVQKTREFEIKYIKVSAYIKALNNSFMIFLNRTGIFLCVITHILTGNEISAKYVYVVSAFFAILRQNLTVYFPKGINNISESNVSISRIQEFLLKADTKQRIETPLKDEEIKLLEPEPPKELPDHVLLKFENATIGWCDDLVEKINFSAISSDFIAITGPVGSGKSTILLSMLEEIKVKTGAISIRGSVSYAAQEPWLFSGTIRRNIIFQAKFDPVRYDIVKKICCLEDDLKQFELGDENEVGENGALLSGGQRARINLARAVYKSADVYLLDDPLAAVDATVARQIFRNCFLDFLRYKCVVLVTHKVELLEGTVDKIYEIHNGVLNLVNNSVKIDLSFVPINNESDNIELDVKNGVAEVKAENQKTGKVSRLVYWRYLQSGAGIPTMITILFMFLLTQIFASAADYFPTFWINLHNDKTIIFTTEMCLKMYTFIILACIIISLIRSVIFFRFCTKAALVLHNSSFGNIIKATMLFFNQNSSGQILNRFAKDMGQVDEMLPTTLIETIQIGFILAGNAILVIFLNYYLILPTIAITALFYYFRIIFLVTSRNLKRTESEAKSPVLSKLKSSIAGLTTIRCFNVEQFEVHQFDQLQDVHSSAFYVFLAANRGFGFWIDMICVFYVIIVLTTIFLLDSRAGNVGLAITQSVNLIGIVQWGLRQWSELENQMVSVERIVNYSELKSIEQLKGELIPDWLKAGKIEFESVNLNYCKNTNLTLRDITFVISPGEQIGIVGRTGSGKTSLISILFRLYDYKGTISIDDRSIERISLKQLRRSISIIPQNPILFTGTIRQNIDPFVEFEDEQIWRILQEVDLKDIVTVLPGSLEFVIFENGSNFSIGQKQLFCLARALLRNQRILILDEATANIDKETSALIHKKLKNRQCTTLIIAHRLESVMDSDRVMVLNNGSLAEFEKPQILLQNTNSMFYSLYKENLK